MELVTVHQLSWLSKAFDSADRRTLWTPLQYYGGSKTITMERKSYDGLICKSCTNGNQQMQSKRRSMEDKTVYSTIPFSSDCWLDYDDHRISGEAWNTVATLDATRLFERQSWLNTFIGCTVTYSDCQYISVVRSSIPQNSWRKNQVLEINQGEMQTNHN